MIIGIGGVSRAGKSTLADLINKQLISRGYTVTIMHQDNYPVKESDLPVIRDRLDWEIPASIEHETYYQDVCREIENSDIIILEGLFCYYDSRLVALMNKKILIEIDKATFLSRKLEDLRWGSEPEPDWYKQHIWDRYQKYGVPHDLNDCFIIDGTKYFNLVEIMNYLGL